MRARGAPILPVMRTNVPAAALFLVLALPASAQAPAPAPLADPSYQQRMERLAEVLGALHHLRGLCVTQEAQAWRQEMQNLIEAEQPSADRRDRLVAGFNRGLEALRETYRTCTPAARLAADRYRTDGLALARELAARFAD